MHITHSQTFVVITGLALAVLVVGKAHLRASVFPDVSAGYRYASSIDALVRAGVVNGYPDGTFRPEKTIARAEFVKIIAGALKADGDECLYTAGQTGATPDRLFRDVPWTSWYLGPLCVALERKLVSGYPDRTFRPADPIDMASMAKILTRAFALPVTSETRDAWYDPFLRALRTKHAVPPTITSPADIVTRGEMAEMLSILANDPASAASALSTSPAAVPPSPGADPVLSLVNEQRSRQGLSTLRWNETLAAVAQAHAEDMVARHFYDHVNPDGLNELARIKKTDYLTVDFATCNCTGWSYDVGENITRAGSAEEAMRFWMDSPKHRANILSTGYEELGVGSAGNLWVQVFGRMTVK